MRQIKKKKVDRIDMEKAICGLFITGTVKYKNGSSKAFKLPAEISLREKDDLFIYANIKNLG